ncbi:uncharacterized protein LOC144773821 [Lissotriton helveticus]
MRLCILLTCLLSVTLAMPLPPHPNHPGYINFSYEVMTPLKWYQSMMRQPYPSYGYEPMGGWLQSQTMPGSPIMPQQHFPQMHAIPPMQPHHHMMLPQQPMLPHQQILPQHQQLLQHLGQQPLLPQQPTHVQQTAQASQPILPHQPQQSGQPIFPVQQQPPLQPDAPLEPWQPTDKTNQDEQDKWYAILNKCSLDLILLIIEELSNILIEIEKEIVETTDELTKNMSSEDWDTLIADINQQLDKHSNDINERKIRKFRRDTLD